MTAPLLVDCYEGDDIKPAAWTTLALVGKPWCGAILKASEGSTYKPQWFRDSWPAVKRGSGPRYGIDWFRGAYHYLRFSSQPDAQAAAYLAQIDAGGGWSDGDLWPIVDVERTGNDGTSKAKVIDYVCRWSAFVLAETGRAPMLYGGSWLRELRIKDRMGCQLLWTPRYTAKLPATSYTALGFDLTSTWGWQYCGDGEAKLPGYPKATPIGAKLDISAVIINGGSSYEACVTWTRTHLGTRPT